MIGSIFRKHQRCDGSCRSPRLWIRISVS